jgi:hypothetical protein
MKSRILRAIAAGLIIGTLMIAGTAGLAMPRTSIAFNVGQ